MPYLSNFERVFSGSSIVTENIEARYLPTGIRASIEPIGELFAGDGKRSWNDEVVANFDMDPID